MHEIPLLRDLVILIAVAIPVVVLMHRFKVPTLVGFLITGALIGPSALGLIARLEEVRTLAEIGAVLLLFAIGLELSLSRVVKLGSVVLKAGAGQLFLTTGIFALAALPFGIGGAKAVLFGLLIALSSTAIILKVYADRGELDGAPGRVVVAILLFQDLCVVPMMLLLPFLAGENSGIADIVRGIGVTFAVTAGILVIGRRVVPWLLARIVALRDSELFTLCVLAIGLGSAYATAAFGLSLALGAFLAGLLISESDYGLQALSDILPFRDTFSGIFFTSVGMLLDMRYVAQHLAAILGLAVAILVIKSLVGYFVVRFVRRSQRVGVVAGISIAQAGEFSFVLAGAALSLGLLTSTDYQLFLGAAVVSMLVAPFAVNAAPAIADWIFQFRAMPTMEFATREVRAAAPLDSHTIIVGYGLNGRNVARALRRSQITYAIIEANGQIVREARLGRENVFFGDGTRGEILNRVGIKRAKILVLCLSSVSDERRAVAVARQISPTIHIIARTRKVEEIAELHRLGADEVVPEEFETSIEIFSRVLRKYGTQREKIREAADVARSDHYELLRTRGVTNTPVDHTLGRSGHPPAEAQGSTS